MFIFQVRFNVKVNAVKVKKCQKRTTALINSQRYNREHGKILSVNFK